MEPKEKVSLDRVKFVKLLEKIGVAVENKIKTKDSIKNIDKALTNLIQGSNLDKRQLVTKWVQLSGKDAYENLHTKNIKQYYEKLAKVLQSGAIYLNKTGDPLYLLAELVILTDWYLYRKINLQGE